LLVSSSQEDIMPKHYAGWRYPINVLLTLGCP